jgi:hypothetical protein
MFNPARFCTHPSGDGRTCDMTEPTHDGGQLGHAFQSPATQAQQPRQQRPQLAAVPDDPEQEPPGRGLILRPASGIRIRPVRWLWDTTPEGAPPTSHGRIPLYSLCIAAGGPGLGKSQFAVWMTARVTRGELPGELYGKPMGVIYAAAEDSWTYTIAPRLIAAGADMDLVFHVSVHDDERPYARLTLPIDTSLLAQEAERYNVGLMVLDPLLSYIDKGINDYRAAEVRAALEPLVAAADRHHFTILGLAHFTKAGAADPLARVAGSGAFGQLLRSLIAFAKEDGDQDGEERFVMSLEKNNLGRLGLPSHEYKIQPVTIETDEGPSYVSRFVLGPETSTSVRQVMRDETTVGGVDKSERTEAMEWLEDYMTARERAGVAEPKEVYAAAKIARITDNALREAKRRLRIKSVKQKGVRDGGWFWQMPGFDAPSDQQPDS